MITQGKIRLMAEIRTLRKSAAVEPLRGGASCGQGQHRVIRRTQGRVHVVVPEEAAQLQLARWGGLAR
jgi:hypothetical protein